MVTGSSYGLGLAICHKMLETGYQVYGLSRSKTDINSPNFTWIKIDLLKSEQISELPTLLKNKPVDILVNNAGTTVEKSALDFSSDDFDKLFGLNFVAPIKMTRVLFGQKPDRGLVINISSNSDRYPDPLWAMYGSTKAALNLYFDTIAAENPKLKVVSLLPSFIDTPLLRNCYVEEGFDINKSMKPEQVANLVTEVSQNPGKYSSGSRVIVVNNALKSVADNPENLMVYNVETRMLDKIRWKTLSYNLKI